jgi:peptidyl-prolyl cis-trans isomerase C
MRARLLLPALLLLAACGNPQPSAPDPVVAVVGSTQIHQSEFDLRVHSSLTSLAQAGANGSGQSPPPAMVSQVRARVLLSLIMDAVIAAEAKVRQLAATDADVQAELDAQTAAAGGADALRNQLSAAGAGMDQLRDEARSSINERRLEEFFARERAGQALQQVLAPGGDFAAVARNLSDDSSSGATGGDMGAVDAAQLHAAGADGAFTAAAEGLTPGATTPAPVRDQQGFEILRLDRMSGTTRWLHRILVAAPQPYTVRGRPAWFLASLLETVATECSQGRITVTLKGAGSPCDRSSTPVRASA